MRSTPINYILGPVLTLSTFACDGGGSDSASASASASTTTSTTATSSGADSESSGAPTTSASGNESSGEPPTGSGEAGTTGDTGESGGLPVDCTQPNPTDPVCSQPGQNDDDFFPGAIGAGPHFSYGAFPQITGGFLDKGADRLIVSTMFGSDSVNPSGAIVAVALDSGNRTFITGSYVDENDVAHDFGSGEPVQYFTDVKAGPTAWYALGQILNGGKENVLVEINPADGARKVIWREDSNSCPAWGNGNIGPVIDTLAVGDDGKIYLNFSNNPAQAGVGVVAIDPGGTCTIVSRVHCSGNDCSLTVGTGPTPDWAGGYFKGMTFGAGLVWGVEWQTKSLFSIDPANGNRNRVSSTYNGLPNGDIGFGPEMGLESVVFADADTFYTAGGALVSVNGTGDRTALPNSSAGPLKVLDPKGNAFLHTNASWVLVSQKTAIVVLDTATGNSNVLSY